MLDLMFSQWWAWRVISSSLCNQVEVQRFAGNYQHHLQYLTVNPARSGPACCLQWIWNYSAFGTTDKHKIKTVSIQANGPSDNSFDFIWEVPSFNLGWNTEFLWSSLWFSSVPLGSAFKYATAACSPVHEIDLYLHT